MWRLSEIVASTLFLALLLTYAALAAPPTATLTGTIYNLDGTVASNARVVIQNKYTQDIGGVIDPPYVETLITNSGAIPSAALLQNEYLSIAIDGSPPKALQIPSSSSVDLSVLLGGAAPAQNAQLIIFLGPQDANVGGTPVNLTPSVTQLAFATSLDYTVSPGSVLHNESLTGLALKPSLDYTVQGSPIVITQTSPNPTPNLITLTGTLYNGGTPVANARVTISNRYVQPMTGIVVRPGSRTLITDSTGAIPPTTFIQGEQVRIQVSQPGAPYGATQDITLPIANTVDLTGVLAAAV